MCATQTFAFLPNSRTLTEKSGSDNGDTMLTSARKGKEYLLGVNHTELERLRFQHTVWQKNTDSFFDRLKIKKGWKCLDVGAGPGFVSLDLRKRVGPKGEITALEPSDLYRARLSKECRKRGWTNVETMEGTAETAILPQNHYNLVFVRWVIAFVPDRRKFLAPLIKSLKRGGIIAIVDYWYEGLSLYPRGGAFDGAPETVRRYYRSGGGDPYATGKIPELLRRKGMKIIDFTPTQIAGGPDSPITEWAHRFFVPHLPIMAEKGCCSRRDANAMKRDWLEHRKNPNTIFFSPMVIHVAGRK
jgi:SAM-dependent methyltransferase